MTYTLSLTTTPNPGDVQVLIDGIMAYAKQQKGFDALNFFACFVRDAAGGIVAGCSGGTLYGGLHIDSLWVNEQIRNQGWGTKLVQAAIDFGKQEGCVFATVNTMDWEALGFYQRLGFKLEFERHGFHKDSIFYFLRKALVVSETTSIEVRALLQSDIQPLVDAFARHGWPKPKSTFEYYLEEQVRNERCVWVAFFNDELAGYVTLKWLSDYQSFQKKAIPEVMDLNVLPPYRKKGIGSLLLEKAEKEASTRHEVVGLGVGLYRDYGNAQQLYIKKGYIPDGEGITYHYQPVVPGKAMPVDDDLVLWFKKKLR